MFWNIVSLLLSYFSAEAAMKIEKQRVAKDHIILSDLLEIVPDVELKVFEALAEIVSSDHNEVCGGG